MFIIAIDGPASSGKSTIAKILAEKLKITYVDSGAMYRSVTLAAIKAGVQLDDLEALNELVHSIKIDLRPGELGQKVFLNDQEVTKEIRSDQVNQWVSPVSAIGLVREHMVELQRQMSRNQSLVMDGRDIGTVVFPEADYKFYLIASSRVRAERRYQENKEKGLSHQSLEQIEAEIIGRDQYDQTRTISPLKKAEDAVEIDTSSLTIEEVVQKIMSYLPNND